MLWVSTLYCAPLTVRKSGRRRGCEGGGIYPELGWLGFLEGKSPALVRDVARQAALLPSYALARAELLERGLTLNIKEVHNISVHAGPRQPLRCVAVSWNCFVRASCRQPMARGNALGP